MCVKGMNLGALADPAEFTGLLDVAGLDTELLLEFLDKLIEIRKAEEAIADLVVDGVVGTPCHLGIGQEAVAVGVAGALNSHDRVFGGHRSHSQFLALGGDLRSLFAEVLGKETGACRGMGGSMHLFDGEVGFHGSVPIVAGTISIAVGAALAAKMDGSRSIAVCFFGDGAAEEGVLHESLNLAAAYELPVLFVCENNLFSSHLDIVIRQPGNRVSRFADAHGIAAKVVDGNDVTDVYRESCELVDQMRSEKNPGFLEAVTYRHRGHVGPNEDIDVGVRRTMDELMAWKRRDPIRRLVDSMVNGGLVSESRIQEMHEQVAERVSKALRLAKEDPVPDPQQLLCYVYRENS